jgi:hypothetical protein
MASQIKKTEKRFPKAAVDYIDALLEIQQTRFDQEKACEETKPYTSEFREGLNLPKSAHYLAEDEHFTGVGWSSLYHRRDGTGFRWMGRLGTFLLPLDLSSGGTLRIEGSAFSRHRHLKSLTVWIEGQAIQGAVSRRGLNRWHFTGTIPPIPWRPYSILRLQSTGVSKPATGTDSYTSVAVNAVEISPKA